MHVFFTDGSSSTKSGKCGWAVVGRLSCPLCLPGLTPQPSPSAALYHTCEICGGHGVREVKRCGFGDGTNQLAELIALVYAMKISPTNGLVTIVSDSEYSIKAVTEYRRRWEMSGYKTVEGKTICNLELVKYAHRLHDEKPLITFKHVRGHTGVEGNELADALSRSARYVAEGREPLEKLEHMLVRSF